MKNKLGLPLALALGLVSIRLVGGTLDGRSLYHSKTVWENQAGEKQSLGSLRGSPVVIAMLFTRCQGSCPLTMRDLKAIEKGLPSDVSKGIRFAIFSFDSESDTPKVLREFAQKYGVDLSRWRFFHGSSASVSELAALLGIRYRKIDGGMFVHSNVITLLDPEGLILHQQVGIGVDPKESISILSGYRSGN